MPRRSQKCWRLSRRRYQKRFADDLFQELPSRNSRTAIKVTVPDALRVEHEGQLAKVASGFLKCITAIASALPAWEHAEILTRKPPRRRHRTQPASTTKQADRIAPR